MGRLLFSKDPRFSPLALSFSAGAVLQIETGRGMRQTSQKLR